jgi:hypothetical protein
LRVETKLGGGDPVIEKKLNWCVVSAVIIHESTGLACSDGGMASQIAEMIGAAFNDGFRNFPTHSHGDRALSLSLSSGPHLGGSTLDWTVVRMFPSCSSPRFTWKNRYASWCVFSLSLSQLIKIKKE